MAVQSRAYLKTRFETGDIPTQQDYIDLFDTYFSKPDDEAVLANGSGTVANGNKVDLGGLTTKYEDTKFPYATGMRIGSDTSGGQSPKMATEYNASSDLSLVVRNDANLVFSNIGLAEKGITETGGVPGIWIKCENFPTSDKESQITLLNNGEIIIGPIDSARFAPIKFRHDYSAIWDALSESAKDRLIFDHAYNKTQLLSKTSAADQVVVSNVEFQGTISGDADKSAGASALAYIQKGYVDAAIQSGGGKIQPNQLSDNRANIQAGSWNTSGNYVFSTNWISLDKQSLNSNLEQILSGIGYMPSSARRLTFWDVDDIETGFVMGTNNAVDVIFTPPSNTTQIGINIAAAGTVGADPENSTYITSVMLNVDTSALPFEEYYRTDSISTNTQVFVSPSGDNANGGLIESEPVKTIERAIDLNPEEIILMEGDYEGEAFDLADINTIKGKTGDRVRLIYGTKIESASLSGVFTRVYEKTITIALAATGYAWQHDIEDEETVILTDDRHPLHRGRRTRMPSTRIYPAASAQEIEDTTDKLMWYYSGGVFYFSKTSASDLSTNPIVVPIAAGLKATRKKNIFVKGIDILYYGLETANLSGKFSDVSVGMANLAGIIITDDTIGLVLENCEAFGGNNDGFNGHTSSPNPLYYTKQTNLTFINCHSHDNSDDGESHHEYCEVNTNGGLYEFNGNGCTPASGAHAAYNHVMAANNGVHNWTTDQAGVGFSAQGASLDNGVGTNLYCYSCVSKNNIVGFRGLDVSTKWINCISQNDTTDFDDGERIGDYVDKNTTEDQSIISKLTITTNGDKILCLEDDVAEASAFFSITNATGAANIFAPLFTARGNSSTAAGLHLLGSVTLDSGSVPVVKIDARFNNAEVVNRPLLGIFNRLIQLITVMPDGSTGFGVNSAAAKVDINQSDNAAAIPVLKLTQTDLSEEMIKLDATIGTGNPIEAKGAKTFTETHYLKINVEGLGVKYMPIGDLA